MLNLITAQVSTRRTTTNSPKTQHVPTLQSLAKLAIKSDFQDVISLPHNKLSLDNLCYREDDYPISVFCKTTYISTMDRLSTSPTHCSNTFFLSLSKYLPHWTSNSSDEFTFATIKEGQTATPNDIETYLNHLKVDLKIGSEGFPKKIMLVGDEQTYSIVMNLKEQKKDTYQWLYPVPGQITCLMFT